MTNGISVANKYSCAIRVHREFNFIVGYIDTFVNFVQHLYISAAYSSFHQGKMVVTEARAIILLKLSNITFASTGIFLLLCA